jgi:hypothetical protein
MYQVLVLSIFLLDNFVIRCFGEEVKHQLELLFIQSVLHREHIVEPVVEN